MKEIITYRGKQIKIIRDENAQSPTECSGGDTGLFLVANHRECYIPVPGQKRIPSDPAELCEPYRKTHWIFPLEAYIHSGVRLLSRKGNFPDRQWGVSRLGFVFVAKSEWRLSRQAREAALSLISEWNMYLSGDVWGYEAGEDSCWGYYGYDYCVEQAKESVDCQLAYECKARLARLKTFILNREPACLI